MTVVTINDTDPDHLARVVAEMRTLGAPVIRAVRDEVQGVLVALEGSHRVAAALALGLVPTWDVLAEDEAIDLATFDFDHMGALDATAATAGAMRDLVAGPFGDYRGCGFVDFPA